MREEHTPIPGQDWSFFKPRSAGWGEKCKSVIWRYAFPSAANQTCRLLSNEALESLSSRIIFFLPLCRRSLVTTSLDSLVMVRWVELPYNHVSRDVRNVSFFLRPEAFAVLAHANEIYYYQNYWNAWQQWPWVWCNVSALTFAHLSSLLPLRTGFFVGSFCAFFPPLTFVVEAPHCVGPAGWPLWVLKSDVMRSGLLSLPRLQPVEVQQVARHRSRAAGPRPPLEAEHVQQRGLEVPQQFMALSGRTTLQARYFLFPFFRYQTSMVALSQQDLAY